MHDLGKTGDVSTWVIDDLAATAGERKISTRHLHRRTSSSGASPRRVTRQRLSAIGFLHDFQ